MPGGDIETYFEDDQWKNKFVGSGLVSSSHDTKDKAVVVGRETARKLKVEHIIKNEDGTIAERTSYGSDLPGAVVDGGEAT